MQKNPCRVDDPLQNPIDRETYEDAVSLEDGIYPITTDDNTIISSDMVKHGSGTVEDALDDLAEKSVKVGTVSGTTSTSGNLVTNLKVSDIDIIAARCDVSGSITMVAQVATTPPTYGFHVATYDAGMTALTSTAVEIKYFYV